MELKSQNKFSLDSIDFGTILYELLDNDDITDIQCWDYKVWITGNSIPPHFLNFEEWDEKDVDELFEKINKIPIQLGNRMIASFNDGSPFIDGEADYKGKAQLRINAIHSSMTASNLPALAFRKSMYGLMLNDESIENSNYSSKEILDLLKVLVSSGCNVMIAGETGSGKTTLLKYLAGFTRDFESIITMEDTLEAYLNRLYPNKNILALKTTEVVGYSELLKPCLRQNPNWICVSETRGEEVVDLLEAVGTGNRIISTLHTDGAANIPSRMTDMSKLTGEGADRIYRQVHRYLDIGVYIDYYSDELGSHRRITEVYEYYIDSNGRAHEHPLVLYDFEKEIYNYEYLKSRRIKKKLIQSRANYEVIKGVFYDVSDR